MLHTHLVIFMTYSHSNALHCDHMGAAWLRPEASPQTLFGFLCPSHACAHKLLQ